VKLRVVGAGLGRTGTNSLKLALERLLGAPCYHMLEVLSHPEHVPLWHAAVRGEKVDFQALLSGYAAAVDWPASAFYKELAEAFPDAIVLFSVRDAASWWKSADATIFAGLRRQRQAEKTPWNEMVSDLLDRRFTPGCLDDRMASMAAFDRHTEEVRRSIPATRLVEWRPGDGWGPLCAALGVPVPTEPFPHVNTTDEFRARVSLNTR
jgi:hypothetical protein